MLTCQRHLFSIPEDIAYLNSAYMSPQLKAVDRVGQEALLQKSRPWEISVRDFFEPVQRLKSLFNELIQGEDPGRVALIPAASYGMATISRNLDLGPGDEIVLVQEQFPSNVLSWQRLARESGAGIRLVEAPPAGPDRSRSWNERLLEAIGPSTRLVALAHVHWADGTLFDLPAVRRRTREVNAWMVIDGTQSVGALPFSVAELQPDALVCGGYKWLLGPYSLGLAYFGPAMDNGIPIEENWYNRLNSDQFGGLVEYEDRYGPLAQRFNVGESSNFALVPMLSRALEQILDWGVAGIADYSRSVARNFMQEALAAGFGFAETPDRARHLLGLQLPEGLDPGELKARLQEERIYVSIRGSSVRISVHIYNREEELARLLHHLKKVLRARFQPN